MDIKKEIGSLQLMERMRVRIFDSGDAAAVSRCHAEIDNAMRGIIRWLDMAEAAIALAQHQAASVGDPVADEAAYYRERCKLWDAFMAAKDKAKEVDREST